MANMHAHYALDLLVLKMIEFAPWISVAGFLYYANVGQATRRLMCCANFVFIFVIVVALAPLQLLISAWIQDACLHGLFQADALRMLVCWKYGCGLSNLM